MRKLILNVYDGATGQKFGFHSPIVITNKSWDNKRIGWDMNAQAWTLNVTNWKDPNDVIEFYVHKPNSMAVDHRYKLITYKVKDIPTDRYGNHNIIMEKETSINNNNINQSSQPPDNTHTQPAGNNNTQPTNNNYSFWAGGQTNTQSNHNNNTTDYTPSPTKQAGFPVWLKLLFGGMAVKTAYNMFFKKSKPTK